MSKIDRFNLLPNETILKIMSYCTGTDLLRLSETCKRFVSIISDNFETMAKIPLLIDFAKPINPDDVLRLIENRSFVALSVVNIKESMEFFRDTSQTFFPLLGLLSETITDLTIKRSEMPQKDFDNLMSVFLPSLKICRLEKVVIGYEDDEDFDESLEESIVFPESFENYPLEVLELKKVTGEIVKFFADCTQLKRFDHLSRKEEQLDRNFVNALLCQQLNLKHVFIDYEYVEGYGDEEVIAYNDTYGFAWSRMSCKLDSLDLYSTELGDEKAAAEFLDKQKNLTKLSLCFNGVPSRDVMEVICGLRKLKYLSIDCEYLASEDNGDSLVVLAGLESSTLKHLELDGSDITVPMTRMFRGLDTIKVNLFYDTLNLTDVPFEYLEKMELIEHDQHCHFRFEPIEVPANVSKFENAVERFVQMNVFVISGITIGHPNWLKCTKFSLSIYFCFSIVQKLPNLKEIVLYNVECPKAFEAFLKKRKNIQNVKLHNQLLE